MIKVFWSKGTKTWRTYPENYMLLGILHDRHNIPRLYTDYAINRVMLDGMAKHMPKFLYKIVKKVIDNR